MKITNTTKRDLGLSPEIVIPAGGSLDVSEADLERVSNSLVVQAWVKDGWIVGPDADKAASSAPISDERYELISGIMRGLDPVGFTNSGKPDVGAINAVLPKTSDRVSAQERDAVWAQMQVA